MNGVKHMQTNYDDITRAAIKLGFSAAAVMDTGNLVLLNRNTGYFVKKTSVEITT